MTSDLSVSYGVHSPRLPMALTVRVRLVWLAVLFCSCPLCANSQQLPSFKDSQFECYGYTGTRLTCAWPNPPVEMDYTLTVTTDNGMQTSCSLTNASTSCKELPDPQQVTYVCEQLAPSQQFHFSLTSIDPNTQSLPSQRDFHIPLSSLGPHNQADQLARLQNFTFHPKTNSLSWIDPNTQVTAALSAQIHYEIEVWEFFDQKNQFLVKEIKLPYKTNTVTLPQLTLDQEYCFQISYKLNNSTIDDNYQQITRVASNGSPNVQLTTYDIIEESPMRVRIYWWTHPNATEARITPKPDLKIAINYSASAILENLSPNVAYEVEISQTIPETEFGPKVYTQTIVISEYGRTLPKPQSITSRRHFNSFDIAWTPPLVSEHEIFYTLVWCRLDRTTNQFEDRIGWLNTRSNALSLGSLNTSENYQFGIVVNSNTSGIVNSSGIHWAMCYDRRAVRELDDVLGETSGPTSIAILLNFLCDGDAKLIPQYRILYCPVDSCGEMQTRQVYNNDSLKRIELDELTPSTTYRMLVTAPTLHGTYETKASTSDPIRDLSKMFLIFKIVAGFFGFVFFIGLVFSSWIIRKNRKRLERIQIRVGCHTDHNEEEANHFAEINNISAQLDNYSSIYGATNLELTTIGPESNTNNSVQNPGYNLDMRSIQSESSSSILSMRTEETEETNDSTCSDELSKPITPITNGNYTILPAPQQVEHDQPIILAGGYQFVQPKTNSSVST